ncbi:hypothetical protein N7532_009507 [Penicillium argentinense]|uniref:Alpha/beta hydrolase fold-3 domain-containing protein n=1 Tax=Penicillium argentinense TaxID=1131581 RepID=A0A9W9K2M5_9EURO|nr:uncharacterized protein N7532_009507 [Penicillium argentinense]KAJ5090823.1 hypothetical protein N7532_009507 [Penicillium argentinense]
MSAKALQTDMAVETPAVQFPFPTRFVWCLKILLFKAATIIFALFRRRHNPTPVSTKPTLVKRYLCRPMLNNRIFFPPQYQPGNKPIPLYLDIHGGGFAVGSPRMDDEFCTSWARRTGMLVVSLDYRKAPRHPFPTATYDIAALINAVLGDEALPIDKVRVAIGGFSAGGNLALSVSQLQGIKDRITAAVVYYPVVDFGVPPQTRS